MNSRFKSLIWFIGLLYLSLLFLAPIFVVVTNSLKGQFYINDAPFSLPTKETFVGFENYINGIDVAYDNEEMICNISIGVSKNNIELNLLLPDPMENAYFPESYKYYDYDNTLNNSTQP